MNCFKRLIISRAFISYRYRLICIEYCLKGFIIVIYYNRRETPLNGLLFLLTERLFNVTISSLSFIILNSVRYSWYFNNFWPFFIRDPYHHPKNIFSTQKYLARPEDVWDIILLLIIIFISVNCNWSIEIRQFSQD